MSKKDFEKYVARFFYEPFSWGRNDCCLFAANAHYMVNGIDYMQRYRGYRSELGAWSMAMRNFGTTNMKEILLKMASRNHWTKVRASNAKDGDITTRKLPRGTTCFPDGYSVALVVSGRVWAPASNRLLSTPLDDQSNEIWRLNTCL